MPSLVSNILNLRRFSALARSEVRSAPVTRADDLKPILEQMSPWAQKQALNNLVGIAQQAQMNRAFDSTERAGALLVELSPIATPSAEVMAQMAGASYTGPLFVPEVTMEVLEQAPPPVQKAVIDMLKPEVAGPDQRPHPLEADAFLDLWSDRTAAKD
jgi:hypothetical protein